MPGLVEINPVKLIGAVAGAAVGGYVIYKGVSWLSKQQALNALKSAQASTIKPLPGKVLYTIAGKPVRSMNLDTIVTDLNDALKFPADEARAIRVFMTIPFGYVKKVETMYLDKYGDNLKETMAKKFSDSEFIKVKYYFE